MKPIRLFTFFLCIPSVIQPIGDKEILPDSLPRIYFFLNENITNFKGDAIVNETNEELKSSGRTSDAIFNAAGADELEKECNAIPEDKGIRCPVGQARITYSCNLMKKNIKYIIHAAHPQYDREQFEERCKLLESVYVTSLKLAEENNISCIAFPLISTETASFPAETASDCAVKGIITHFKNHEKSSIKCIYFYLRNPIYIDLTELKETFSKSFSNKQIYTYSIDPTHTSVDRSSEIIQIGAGISGFSIISFICYACMK